MKHIFTLMLVLLLGHSGKAQSRYVVRLKDKAGTPYSLSNPSQYLGPRALARRTRHNIAIDSADLPVVKRYIDSIRLSGAVTILNTSKWLNQVCFQTNDAAALTKINSFPFVSGSTIPVGNGAVSINPVNKVLDSDTGPVTPQGGQGTQDVFSYGASFGQIRLHQGEFLHNRGFSGKGMQIAVTDAGFYRYQNLPTFDSVRLNGQILGTWDFVANDAAVNEDHPHGMQCLSTIAANMPGTFVGTAPQASFYLFRTEDAATENPVEEQNWAAGAELADSLGVDILSVSLGYNLFDNPAYNYTYSNMNGNTTIIARAADMAARKGLLVSVAAGNSGAGSWKYIISPGDADSVLTVGAVNTSRLVAGFSSYGPSSDGQVKPDVAAVGLNAIVASTGNGQPSGGNGTSFACPNMTGLAACLWQAFPEVNNMDIIEALRQSGDRFTTPNDRTGYGIPDIKKATVLLIKKLATVQSGISNCTAAVNWTAKADTGITFFVERKLAAETDYKLIFSVAGTGTFSTKTNMGLTDNLQGLPPQAIRYRIRMAISRDTSFYLDSMSLNHTVSCGGLTEKITISPNPVKDLLKVAIQRINAVNIAITLQNTAGQQLYNFKTQQPAGGGIYQVPMKQLAAGVYYISVFIDNKKIITKKIVR